MDDQPQPMNPVGSPAGQAPGSGVPPVAPAPPPISTAPLSASPMDEPLDDDLAQEEALSAFSPFKVMQPKVADSAPTPVAPVQAAPPTPQAASVVPLPTAPLPVPTPTSAPSASVPQQSAVPTQTEQTLAIPTLSREQLLEQAAKAPTESFVLPSTPPPGARPVVPTTPSVPPVALAAPAPSIPSIPPAQKVPMPAPPLPTTAPQFAIPPSRLAQVAPVPALETPKVPAPKRDTSGLVRASLIGVGALILVAGGAVGAAYMGIRIPVLYQAISNVPPTGAEAAQNGLAVLTAQSSARVTVQLDLTAVTKDENAGGSVPDQSSDLSTISGTYENGELTGTTGLYQGAITVNGNAAVPIVFSYPSDAAQLLLASFPDNTVNKAVSVDPAALSESLAYTALYPHLYVDILKGIDKELAYAKRTVNGKSVSQYHYSLTPSLTTRLFGADTTVTTATADVQYAWGTGLPVAFSFSSDVTKNEKSYTVRGVWYVKEVGLPRTDSLAQISTPLTVATAQTDARPITADQFYSLLGISVSGGVVVPTGSTITVVQPVITATPKLPVTPATELMKQRDTQRRKDMYDLQIGLDRYQKAKGNYPVASTLVQTRASQELLNSLVPTYMSAIPVDPLNDEFWYEYLSVDGKSYRLRAVAENATDSLSRKGTSFSYFEATQATYAAAITPPSASPTPTPTPTSSAQAETSSTPTPSTAPSVTLDTTHTNTVGKYSFKHPGDWVVNDTGSLSLAGSPATAADAGFKNGTFADITISVLPYTDSTTTSQAAQVATIASNFGNGVSRPIEVGTFKGNSAVDKQIDSSNTVVVLQGQKSMLLVKFPGVAAVASISATQQAIMESIQENL